jgi:16S rRNA (uracil1498-N3)-methyltransferase
MHTVRIYFSGNLRIGGSIQLDHEASRHVLKVLRLITGDQIVLFNNSDQEFVCTIISCEKNTATLKIEDATPCITESPLKIFLAQGIARGEKMDFTIQKSVELGVTTITPIFTEFCNVKLDDARQQNRLTHWQKIAQNASEQSGRCVVPTIEKPITLTKWLQLKHDFAIILDPQGELNFKSIKTVPKQVALLVGPEGGLSNNEIECAKKNGFLTVNLGPRILRTETAALAAISIMQEKWS